MRTHLKMQTIGDSPTRIAPSSADDVVCAGETMAVSIASGGTAGDVGLVLFHWNGARFVVARSWHARSFRPYDLEIA